MAQAFQMTRGMRIGTDIFITLLRAGIPMGPLRLLAHTGRKSGKQYTTPVALVEQNGTRWLVAAFGEVNWVHNIRAAGEAQFVRGRRVEHFKITELNHKQAAPILKQFLKQYSIVPFIPPYFTATAKDSLADFEQEALMHPVFRIDDGK